MVSRSQSRPFLAFNRWRRTRRAKNVAALGLVVLLYRRKPTLDAEAWSELKEC